MSSLAHPFVFAMTRALQKTDVWEKFLLFLGRRRGIAVAGDSMAPTLRDGDVVLVGAAVGLAEGDIVLARHPFKRSVKMLKRIDRIDAQDRFWLVGDNPNESSDSRSFGPV